MQDQHNSTPGSAPIRVGVREMCDFLCRAGSLDAWAGVKRMVEGTRLHNIIQSRGGAGYVREVTFRHCFSVRDMTFELSGRADGIIDEEDGYTVDEIKTTTLPLRLVNDEDYPAHRAQAVCYACMFALEKGLDRVRTRITYANLETEDCIYFYAEHTRDELVERVLGLLLEYSKWVALRESFETELRSTAKTLRFPYPGFREGQEEMIQETYRAMKQRERLFVEAPTGIGKTISAIYPAFRALGSGVGKRIFYLTSKTTLQDAASGAVGMLRKAGLRARSIILTAKEKCCLCREAVRDCDSLVCEYSEGHYSRVNEALFELLTNFESFDQPLIEQFAEQYRVCPYELSLDLALWCDIIICDYNYLFDPRVYLRRFFSDDLDPDENLFLIDEAHNLAARARNMYSSELRFSRFLKLLKQLDPEDRLYMTLRGLCKSFLRLKRRAENSDFDPDGRFDMSRTPYEAFAASVEGFANETLEWLKVNRDAPFVSEVADLRAEAVDYTYKLALFDETYSNYVECPGDEIRVKLLCLDPSKLLSARLSRGRAALLFSATLTPLDYFADVLGGGDSKVTLELESPFPRENLFVGVMDKVSTRFQDRDRTIHAAAEIIESTVNAKPGNYIAYFPSYRLMRETVKAFRAIDRETRCIMQKPEMSETDRDAFLRCFDKKEPGKTLLAFAVLGGIFGEGIDLSGDRLIGVIIVGVGMAQLNTESNIIANYYDETREAGFDYAYVFPGMNKVLQAAGRVIRSETDRGVVILIDDRFATPQYTRLFPRHWKRMRLIGNCESLEAALDRFWYGDDR